MHIGVCGSGYLATVVSACVADFGTPVTCFDDDFAAINSLAQGKTVYFERNLEEVLRRNIRAGRLVHSTETDCVRRSAVIYIAHDSAERVEASAMQIAKWASPNAILLIVTPVSVGTAQRIEKRVAEIGATLTVVSHPLFLTDGCAIEDFNWPDRILLGTSSPGAVATIKQLYRPLVMRGVPVIVTNHQTAELVRESTTAFLATKIAFINELATLCENVHADAVDLALALGLDKKIAPRCLQPGAAFGGAFAAGDMDSLARLASDAGVQLAILGAARQVNASLTDRITDKICSVLNSIEGKQLALLGLSFKPNTNSVAGSASLELARMLAERGARVRAYDPVAMPVAQREVDALNCCESAYAAAEGSEALIVGTGWPEFRALDFEKIKRVVKRPVIVDTKNLLDGMRLRSMGFQYLGMGRA